MQLRRDYYKEIKVCPICKGRGILNPNDPSYRHEFCDECEGFGAYIDEEKGRIVYGLPLFVDYPTRRKLLMAKVSGIAVLLLIIIISVLIII